MTERLVLHIGDRKSGTTAIQDTLSRGAWEAKGAPELLYPTDGLNHVPLIRGLREYEDPSDNAQFSAVAETIRASNAEVAVISAEHFEVMPPQIVRANIDRHLPDFTDRMQIVCYLRPHAGSYVSRYAEQTKLGDAHGTPGAFLKRMVTRRRLHYAERMAAWKAEFGDALTVRPVIRSELARGDVVADFMALALPGRAVTFEPAERPNASLSLEDLALMRIVQDQLRADGIKAAFMRKTGKRLGHALQACAPENQTPFRPWRDLAVSLRQEFEADARATDAAWFDAPLMTDALNNAVEKARPRRPPVAGLAALSPDLDRAARDVARELARIRADEGIKAAHLNQGDFWDGLARRLRAAA